MATFTWNISDCYYNDTYKTSWLNSSVNSNLMTVGGASGNSTLYSSYFTFYTSESFSASSKLTVKITTGGANQIPYATIAVLSTKALTPNQIYPSQSPTSSGMSTSLSGNAIATARAKTASGTNATSAVAAGTNIYYTFETKALKPNTTYYVYFLRASDYTSYSSTGWMTIKDDSLGSGMLVVTLEADLGVVYIDNGGSLVTYQCYIDNGSSWDLYIPYIDNGSSWDIY